jgi:hypothetical protein
MPFYSKVENWSQKYATTMGIHGLYSHVYKQAMAAELLHFDMAVMRDGVLGGSDGAICCRWSRGKLNYDMETAGATTHSRWLQTKRVYKICDIDLAPKKGDADYDPAYKYNYIYSHVSSTTLIRGGNFLLLGCCIQRLTNPGGATRKWSNQSCNFLKKLPKLIVRINLH